MVGDVGPWQMPSWGPDVGFILSMSNELSSHLVQAWVFSFSALSFYFLPGFFQIIKGKSRCQKVHRISCWRWHSHCGKWRWKRCRVCLKLDQFSPNWAQSQWEQCLLQISAILIFGSTLSPNLAPPTTIILTGILRNAVNTRVELHQTLTNNGCTLLFFSTSLVLTG